MIATHPTYFIKGYYRTVLPSNTVYNVTEYKGHCPPKKQYYNNYEKMMMPIVLRYAMLSRSYYDKDDMSARGCASLRIL